jgi:hypothetical protein
MGKMIDDDDEDGVDPFGPTVRRPGGRAARHDSDFPDATVGRNRRTGLARSRLAAEGDETTRFTKRPGTTDDEEAWKQERPLPAGWLVVIAGPGLGHAVPIQAGMNRLGRDPDEQMALPFGDTGISRKDHARFSYDDVSRTFHVMPGMGPVTRLRHELVKEAAALAHGDRITVGGTVLRFMPFCDADFDWVDALEK